MTIAIVILANLLTNLVIFLLPNFPRRQMLFGVMGPDDFRSSPEGRRAVRVFRLAVGGATVAGVIVLVSFQGPPFYRALVLAPVLTVAVAIAIFVPLNRHLRRYAVQAEPIRELELSTEPERLPRHVWLGVVPMIFLVAAALYIRAHWDSIPETFPVHWRADGQPNRWTQRTSWNLYSPLIFGGVLVSWFFAFILAMWYGTRRSEPQRVPTILVLLVVQWLMASVMMGVSLTALIGPRFWTIGLVFLPLLLGGVVYVVKKGYERQARLDPTPSECWKGGMIYYNPNDAAWFVARRDGMGLTANTANPWVWVGFLTIPAIAVLARFMLR